MSTFLFVWNPSKDPDSFDDYNGLVEAAAAGGAYLTRWRCQSKVLQRGDIVYMHRTGPRDNGIFARGVVVREVHENNLELCAAIKLTQFIAIGSEIIMSDIMWSSRQNSNQQIPNDVLQKLEREWSRRHHTETPDAQWRSISSEDDAAFDDEQEREGEEEDDETDADGGEDGDAEAELNGVWHEGEVAVRMHAHRHRERQLRDLKIRETQLRDGGRLQCQIAGCGFDFEQAYGAIGAGFAEVHHLIPLSVGERETTLDDLLVVCSNCHAMLHRGGAHRDPASLSISAKR